MTGSAPHLLNRSYTITAEILIPEGGAEGILLTEGGRFGGYGFYFKEGRPVFTWNLAALQRVKWRADKPLAPGRHTVVFDWQYDGPGLGKGGTGTLSVDGSVVDRHPMPRSLPIGVAWDEPFSVGVDAGTPVDHADYAVPFRFTGTIEKVTVRLGASGMPGAAPAKVQASP